jgi:UDP-N-acetylglucosamine 2-epimerase (non-hydrolysing)
VLLVVGDVNSTLGCALVAAKTSFDGVGARPLIAHVEAGLRSFDRSMPEEVNRILTDQVSDFLFVTEESAVRNLSREGISPEKVHFVGNTMIDSLIACRNKAQKSMILHQLGLGGWPREVHINRPYALLTLHRPANVDNRPAFLNILHALDELRDQCQIVFPAHPRTRKRIVEQDLERYFTDTGNDVGLIRLIEPLGYVDFLCLIEHSALVVTDSGGIQEETTYLGIPCVTARDNTERPVTVSSGTNVLAGTHREGIRSAIRYQLGKTFTSERPEKWDGAAGQRIIDILKSCSAAALPMSGRLSLRSASLTVVN